MFVTVFKLKNAKYFVQSYLENHDIGPCEMRPSLKTGSQNFVVFLTLRNVTIVWHLQITVLGMKGPERIMLGERSPIA
jgi:hypothetical protein